MPVKESEALQLYNIIIRILRMIWFNVNSISEFIKFYIRRVLIYLH